MTKLHQRVSQIVNALLLVALALTIVNVAAYSRRVMIADSNQSLARTVRERITVGDHVKLAGRDVPKQPALLIAVSTTCPITEASLPALKKLIANATRPTIVLSGDSRDEVQTWLAKHEMRPSSVEPDMDMAAFGLAVVPSVIIVESGGAVNGLWEGELPETVADRIIAQRPGDLVDNSLNPDLIEETEWQHLRGQGGSLLLDVRPRDASVVGRRSEATQIPYDELKSRAQVELNLEAPIVIDCPGPSFGQCLRAGRTLRKLGASQVKVLVRDLISIVH